MIEATRYAGLGSAHDDDAGLLRRLGRRLFAWSPVARHACNGQDAATVAPDEFERVRQCLSNPRKPSAAAIEGADILRRLPTPNH
jgi:hypothetical protein